ncbi:helix-turn-helix transcriptional regulator [Klebsiella pneumoniae subsp. pneumoniae]|nr:helix-turn-helix transcriptional regulator [Klebsiella pneumoniae subsp. pneumoniae]
MKNEPLCRAPAPSPAAWAASAIAEHHDPARCLRGLYPALTSSRKSSNVAPNILSRRLKELVDDGLLEKVCYSSTPPRYEYHLTAARPRFPHGWLLALAEWGNRHFAPGRASDAAGGNGNPAPRGASHGG